MSAASVSARCSCPDRACSVRRATTTRRSPCCGARSSWASTTSTPRSSTGPNVSNELIREALHPYPADLALVSKVGGAPRRDGRLERRHSSPTICAPSIEENLPRWAPTGSPRSTCASTTRRSQCSRAASNRELFDRQLDRDDQGSRRGADRRHRAEQHHRSTICESRWTAPRSSCVQNAYNLVDRTSQPVLDACIEHGIAFVPFFPLGSAFTADNPVLGHPAVKRRGREAGPHALRRSRWRGRCRSRRTCC